MAAQQQVAHPPAKPLLVYDGDCGFCRTWLARWREITAPRVDDAPLQEVAAQFPEIPREQFENAVQLIETDGQVFSGAEAVFRSLGKRKNCAPSAWCYEHLPAFATVTEAAYRLVARHRSLAQKVTRLLWGNDVRRPSYATATRWFLRSLGAIYLIAFLSFWVQADGLVGTRGVAPLGEFLRAAHEQLGAQSYHLLPTLCWWNASNAFLHFLCGAGAVISALLILGVAPLICLPLLFVDYLSLTVAGQDFLSFQWDILLLEAGLLAIFLAPARWWLRRSGEREPPRVALFLLQFLLFKLMFMSGAVKLTSGDSSWWNGSALDYHFRTQPLPTVLGWWADKAPEWWKHFATGTTLAIELIGPLLFCCPRRLRLLGTGAVIFLQVCIGLTGNYAFFNLLTIALCLLLIDDAVWPARRLTNSRPLPAGRWSEALPALVLVVTFPLDAILIAQSCAPSLTWPNSLGAIDRALEPFHVVNGYGLFRVMTKERPEIVIEGSDDGFNWKPYVFKWKAGPLARAPGWVQPHQPRLDWQMWFAALSDPRQNQWFFGLVTRLLQGEPDVLRLLSNNPFPQKPPRYLRADIYRYRFSTIEEHARTGNWWERSDRQTYLPEASLRNE